jgi:hypothetical protein
MRHRCVRASTDGRRQGDRRDHRAVRVLNSLEELQAAAGRWSDSAAAPAAPARARAHIVKEEGRVLRAAHGLRMELRHTERRQSDRSSVATTRRPWPLRTCAEKKGLNEWMMPSLEKSLAFMKNCFHSLGSVAVSTANLPRTSRARV